MYNRKTENSFNTPFDHVLQLLSTKWNSRILSIFYKKGVLRYKELRFYLPGISDPVLSSSLKQLEAEKILIRTQYTEVPLRVEYSLTERGFELIKLCRRICEWGSRFYPSVPPNERLF